METQNLWPDFPTEEIKGPKAILKEQAAYLSEKTKNVLSAEIVTTQYGGKFSHAFYVVAPTLSNYRYRLFRIEHGALYYPLFVLWDEKEDEYDQNEPYFPEVDNEKLLLKYLHDIFTASSTIKVISSLLSQSHAEQPL